MSRSTATILAIAGLSLAGLGAAAHSGPWSGPEVSVDEKQAATEVTVKNRPNDPAKTRASTRAEASSSSRASASASASTTVSGDGQADCTTEATATAESDGERITAHQVRRFRGAEGGCNSSARATTEGSGRGSSRK